MINDREDSSNTADSENSRWQSVVDSGEGGGGRVAGGIKRIPRVRRTTARVNSERGGRK